MASILQGEELIEAIVSADESTLRAVLRGVCADRDAQQLVGKHLYEVNKLKAAKEAKETSTDNSSSGLKKRKASTAIQICIQCNQAFEEDDNRKECRYHPGMDT